MYAVGRRRPIEPLRHNGTALGIAMRASRIVIFLLRILTDLVHHNHYGVVLEYSEMQRQMDAFNDEAGFGKIAQPSHYATPNFKSLWLVEA